MSNHLLEKFLAPRRMEYLAVNRDFIILDTSSGIQRFAERPSEVIKGNDVRVGFPELIGVEDYLIAVLEGQQSYFNLKGISRFSANNEPLYFDLYVVEHKDEIDLHEQLVVCWEEVTERMVMEQTLVQASNETNLLMSALSASKEYLAQIVTSMADALIVTNRSGNIKTVNKAAQNLFDYSEQELINKPISLLIAEPNFSVEIFQEYNLSKGELLKDVEVVCQTKTGEKVFVAFSCSVIQTDTDLQPEFIYIGRDITERQQTQQRLVAQYATARALSESNTLKLAAPTVLRAICESLGWTIGELWIPEENKNGEFSSTPNTRLRCVEIWHRSSVAIPNVMANTRQTTSALGMELPSRVWASHSAHWITDMVDDANFQITQLAYLEGLHGAFGFPILGGSEILGVMTFYSRQVEQPKEDLLQTLAVIGNQLGQFIQRKRAEAARSQLANQIRLLLESTDEGIYGLNLQGRCTFINKAGAEMIGYQPHEVLGRNLHELIHHSCSDGSPYPEEQCPIYRTFRNQQSCRVDTEVFWQRQGTSFPVEYSSHPIIEDGIIQGAVVTFFDITERLQAEEALHLQQEQTERLLLNILPEPIANRLKQQPGSIADDFASVSVLFADIVGFTELSARISPTELIEILNIIFSEFDQLAERHGLEKIKTIGDAYMVVGGIPIPQPNHAVAIARMALDIQAAMTQLCKETGQDLSIRIGIHTGPVVAGVIGKKKFIYDLWGDTVNIASRMESHSLPGKIQITAATYEQLRDQFLCDERGAIQVKGKGIMTTYFLIGRKEDGKPI